MAIETLTIDTQLEGKDADYQMLLDYDNGVITYIELVAYFGSDRLANKAIEKFEAVKYRGAVEA